MKKEKLRIMWNQRCKFFGAMRKKEEVTWNVIKNVDGRLSFGEAIEEPFKTFVNFLYYFHLLFHLKVSEILFSNSRLFSHADDHLLWEASSELVEHQLGVGVGGHVKLHLPVSEAAITAHHAVEVLAGTKGLGYALRR